MESISDQELLLSYNYFIVSSYSSSKVPLNVFTSYKHSLQIFFSTNTVESCDNKPSADLSLCTSLDQNRCTFASDFEEEKENGIDRSLADFLRKVGEILNYSFVSFRREYNCFPVLGSERTKTFSSRFYRRRFHACQYCTNVKPTIDCVAKNISISNSPARRGRKRRGGGGDKNKKFQPPRNYPLPG